MSLLHETSLCACFTAGITSGSIRRGCIRSPRSQGSRLPSFACILGELLLLCSDPYRVIHCPRLSLLHPPKSFHKMVRSQPNNPTTSPPPRHIISLQASCSPSSAEHHLRKTLHFPAVAAFPAPEWRNFQEWSATCTRRNILTSYRLVVMRRKRF